MSQEHESAEGISAGEARGESETTPTDSTEPKSGATASDEVDSILDELGDTPVPKRFSDDKDLNRIDREQDINLRRQSHQWVSTLVAFQLIASDALLFFYICLAAAGAFPFDAAVLKWWISGTVVQTIGMGYIVVRYLFHRDN